MAQDHSPNRPQYNLPFVDPHTGLMSRPGMNVVDQMWKQVAAGFVTVPVMIAGTNVLTMTPRLHAEGGVSYGDGMAWCGTAANTSTGSVTAVVNTAQYGNLATVKVFKSPGSVQAGAGDIVQFGVYLFVYNSALDSGAGGFVLK